MPAPRARAGTYPSTTCPRAWRRPGGRPGAGRAEKPGGLVATLRTIADSAALTDQLCAGGSERLQALGAELVVGDQLEPAGYLLAGRSACPSSASPARCRSTRRRACPCPFSTGPTSPRRRASTAHGKHRWCAQPQAEPGDRRLGGALRDRPARQPSRLPGARADRADGAGAGPAAARAPALRSRGAPPPRRGAGRPAAPFAASGGPARWSSPAWGRCSAAT
jgi:hypothetical protein